MQRPVVESDVVIAGAGVAGLALALALARDGTARNIVLVEHAPAPRDKVCGEGVMPLGMAVLERLGLAADTLPGQDFLGLQYTAPAGRHLLEFAPGVRGRGLRRTALLEALEGARGRYRGCLLVRDEVLTPWWQGTRIVGLRGKQADYRASVVVAADGVNSRLTRMAGAGVRPYGYRMGLRRHYRLSAGALPRHVQVGLFGGYDLYLTPVGEEELLATALTDRRGYLAMRGDYDAFLRGGPFEHWFRRAEPASRMLGWYHPLFSCKEHAPGGMLLLGDAGGGIDPCLGMGISMALVMVEAAAHAARCALADPVCSQRYFTQYAAARGSMFRHYYAFGRVFRMFIASRRGTGLLVRGMRAFPRIAERILRVVAEGQPWLSLLRPNCAAIQALAWRNQFPAHAAGQAGARAPVEAAFCGDSDQGYFSVGSRDV